MECQCLGCPKTSSAAKIKATQELTESISEHGKNALDAIASSVGILGPNRKMQELMKERNDKILKAFEEHEGGPDAVWEKKASAIIEEYRVLILDEAEAFKARGEKDLVVVPYTPQKPGAEKGPGGQEKKSKHDRDGDGDGMSGIMVAALCAGGGIALCAALAVVYRFGKSRGSQEVNKSNPTFGSMAAPEGDSNIVMGRPVEEGAEAAQAAAQGAPVPPPQFGSHPGDPPEKNQNPEGKI